MDGRAVAPTAVAAFVGRAEELGRLRRSAGRERLVTVTGPGGCGKTRLVQEAVGGWDVHGVVELAGTGPDGDPATAALGACGLREEPGRPAADVLGERLTREPRLLVLDGCEHVRDAVATLVAALLSRCAALRVVVTSRAPLGLPGEVVVVLSGLDPDGDGTDLFLERAGRVRPALPDGAHARAAAVAVSRMVDGLPFAIELAAAHARSLPLDGIRDGMADRLRSPGARDGTSGRHSSLLSALDWSAEVVGARARAALRALSLLDGPFERDAALAATGDRAALGALVEHALVRFDAADGRYRLPGTVRSYGAGTPDDAGRRDALDRLLAWAAGLARDVRDGLERADADVLRRVARADPALCSVLDRVLESGYGLDVAASVATDLAVGWSLRGRCTEGLSRTGRLVAALDPVPAGLYWAHGFLAFHAGDLPTGLAHARRARDAGDDRVRARALLLLGTATALVDPAAAEPVLEDAVAAATAAGDDRGRVEAAQCLACTHLHRGRPADALRCADDVVAVLRRIGPGLLAAWDAAIRADVAENEGRYADAVRYGHRGVERAVAAGEPGSASGAWLPLLRALVALGDEDGADRVRDDGLRFLDDHPGLGTAGVGLLGSAVVASAGPADAAASAALAARDCAGLAPAGVAEAGLLLAVAQLRGGDVAAARAAAAEAARAARAIGHRGLAVAADLTVAAALRAGGGAPATLTAVDALGAAHDLGIRPRVADALDLVAALHVDAARDPVAARLHAAADRLRAELGVVPSPLARVLAPPAEWSADPALAAATAEGARLGEAGAVGYARRARGRRGRPRAGWDRLTPTEREVVAQVATGRSNAEIGAALLVSTGTVRTHLRSVFAKLGVTSRAELAARAASGGR